MPNINRILLVLVATLVVWASAKTASADLVYTYASASGVAATAATYTASGNLNLTLGFAPAVGTNLTVVSTTGATFISGTFANAPQGGTLGLTYNGVTYYWIVNYYGGANNRSLVLQWPRTAYDTWGQNDKGQLGIPSAGASDKSIVPVAISTAGTPLAGKTIVSIANGSTHTLVLTSDGLMYAWGAGTAGQLGNGLGADSYLPVAVTTAGTGLSGRTVVAISCGSSTSYALTADGRVFAWGANTFGQIGDNTTTARLLATPVLNTGVLASKVVTGIAGGGTYCLAMTSDGKAFAWGYNSYGQLGDNTITQRNVPVAVLASGALSGKTVVRIQSGYWYNSQVLASTGEFYGWGYNYTGQLGDGTTNNEKHVPTQVTTTGTSLAGKTIIGSTSGQGFSMALTSDGAVSGWGNNLSYSLGDGTQTSRTLAGAINAGDLAGVTVASIASGSAQGKAVGTNGHVYTWGPNDSGDLGHTTPASPNNFGTTPFDITPGSDLAGKFVMYLGAFYEHTVAVYGTGSPFIGVNPTDKIISPGSTATFTASASGTPTPTVQWQVSPSGPAGTFSDIAGNASATTNTLSVSNVTLAQNGYAYRAVFTNSVGTATSSIATLGTALTALYSFDGSTGKQPKGIMQASNGSFYGSTGGTSAAANCYLFKYTLPGLYTNLGNLSSIGGGEPSGLIQASDGNLYGNTIFGGLVIGDGTQGVIFKLTLGGTLSQLAEFNDATIGNRPYDTLVQGTDGALYGTSYYGGAGNLGSIFKVTLAGAQSNIASYTGATSSSPTGVNPVAGLIQATDGNFYGTTTVGGITGGTANGTVYKMTPAGVITVMKVFQFVPIFNAGPLSGLIQANDGYLYGTTNVGGTSNQGTLFKISTAGVLTTLVNFSSADGGGYNPQGRLMQASDGNIYGTCNVGGTAGYGTVFRLTPSGHYTTIVSFDNISGANPQSQLIQATDGKIYGVAYNGGSSNFGTIFRFEPTAANGPAPDITSAATANAVVGQAFSYQITASNNPTVFGATGLPNGLTIDANGLISGTPTAIGVTSVQLTAANGNGSDIATLVINVAAAGGQAPAITNGPATATGAAGIAYSFNYTATGSPTPTFSLGSGAFPPGLTISTGGVLSGTPTQAGTFTGTVKAANGVGTDATQNFSLTISETFTHWESLYFTAQQMQTADPNVIGPNANPTKDGTVNLLKFVFDINPAVAMSDADRAQLANVILDSSSTPGTTYLALVYRQKANVSGVTVNLQVSTDLQTWNTVSPAISQTITTDIPTGDPIVEKGVIASGTKQYLRLDVTTP